MWWAWMVVGAGVVVAGRSGLTAWQSAQRQWKAQREWAAARREPVFVRPTVSSDWDVVTADLPMEITNEFLMNSLGKDAQ